MDIPPFVGLPPAVFQNEPWFCNVFYHMAAALSIFSCRPEGSIPSPLPGAARVRTVSKIIASFHSQIGMVLENNNAKNCIRNGCLMTVFGSETPMAESYCATGPPVCFYGCDSAAAFCKRRASHWLCRMIRIYPHMWCICAIYMSETAQYIP